MMLICKTVLLLSACLAIPGIFLTNASAQQSATATLSGAVKDPNGALVAGAQVTVTQKATGIKRQAVSNDVGFFVITNLAAGVYELKVRAKGFADNVVPSVTPRSRNAGQPRSFPATRRSVSQVMSSPRVSTTACA